MPHRFYQLFSSSMRMTFLALAMMPLLSGCGTDHSANSVDEATITQAPDGTAYLTFSPQATQRAAKLATIPAEGLSNSKNIKPDKKAYLDVSDINTKNKDDILKVRLNVPKNGVASEVTVVMTVYGNTLSELIVAFEPGGLVFLIDAVLELELGPNRIDMPLSDLEAYHTYDDGTEVPATIVSIDESGSKTNVTS